MEGGLRAKKVDTTHGAIRDHLRAIGWSVFDTSAVGRGFPDLVCARRGFTALVEAKTPGRGLNSGQQLFSRGWDGVTIKATSPQEAELQLDLAEKYQYLRHPPAYIERPEDYTPPRPHELAPPKPKPRRVKNLKILDMLDGE